MQGLLLSPLAESAHPPQQQARRQPYPVSPPLLRPRQTQPPQLDPAVERVAFSLPRSPSQSSEPAITLVFPVAALAGLQNIGYADGVQILGLLVSQLGRHLQTQRGAVPAIERLPIHLVTEKRLRMERRSHVNRLVVIIRALNFEKPRAGVRSH